MKRMLVILAFLFTTLIVGDIASAGPYALLIAPHTSADASYDEFWNDTVLMYDMLIGTGKYTADSIHVAYGDGIDGTSSNPRYQASITDYAATNAGIDAAFYSPFVGIRSGAIVHTPGGDSQRHDRRYRLFHSFHSDSQRNDFVTAVTSGE